MKNLQEKLPYFPTSLLNTYTNILKHERDEIFLSTWNFLFMQKDAFKIFFSNQKWWRFSHGDMSYLASCLAYIFGIISKFQINKQNQNHYWCVHRIIRDCMTRFLLHFSILYEPQKIFCHYYNTHYKSELFLAFTIW